tara:strand:- start:1524 stop:1940 length:417 start_codon:yes stop_codon:yes gene_type:complete
MKVFFQKKKIEPYIELKKFSFMNKSSGSIQSFIGKMRPMKDNKALSNMEIEFYKKMAYYQTEKNLKNLLKKINIDDFLIIHRYGKVLPSENIILVLVASKHRKEGFIFTKEVLNWFKKKVTFWKKENFKNHSSWVEAE